jgi:thymidylate synthase
MSEGFPLLTTKRMAWNNIVSELLWFLQGRTDLRYLLEHNNQIWVGDAHKAYCNHFSDDNKEPSKEARESFIERIKTDDKFSKKWGDLGPIYGKQWRSWTNYTGDEIQETVYEMTNEPIDQIANLIKDLKENPDSRRLMVNSWNCGEIPDMVLPPCHYGFQFYTRELSLTERIAIWDERHLKDVTDEQSMDSIDLDGDGIPKRALSLSFSMRSADFFLGVPFNIASYGLLLEILAKICNMVPEDLIGNFGDAHLYSNHLDQAKEQISRSSFQLSTLKHMKTDAFWKSFDVTLFGHLDPKDFVLENYQSHPSIKAPLSN